MFTYINLLIIILIGLGVKGYKKYYYLIVTFTLTIVAAFRYDVGTDYLTYAAMVGYGKDLNWVEPGYQLINYLFFILDFPGWSILTFFALITLPLYFKFINRNSINPSLSLLLFFLMGFYFYTFNAVRQMFALAILIFSLHFWIIGKKNISFFGVIFATLFHYTVLIALPIYALALRKWSRSSYVLFIIVAILLGLSGAAMKVPIFFIEDALESPFLTRSPVAIFKVFAPVTFLLYLLFMENKFIRLNYIVFNLFYAYVLITIMTYGVNYFTRFNYYFEFWLVILIPEFLVTKNHYSRLFWVSIFILYFIFLFIGNFLVLNGHNVLPYTTLFENQL